ncbi:MAG: hypothetical protein HDS29_00280 [Bacteroides sp.]|nr:hypothetical protein [Bacteroides sp.]
MSFFKSLAHAFGFGNDEEIVEENDLFVSSDDSVQSSEPVSSLSQSAKDIEIAADFPVELFDSVLEVFNNSQPEFIRECIDRDAQRRYLYGLFGESFKKCIDQSRDQIEKEVITKVAAERDSLIEEIAKLKETLEKAEGHETELNDQRLSDNRQKRALSDKIRTLEQQLDAEKEQHKLEISSLLSKLEAVGGSNPGDGAEQNGSATENSELKTKLSQSNFVAEQLRQEVEKLKKELTETSELYKSRMAMSDKMLSDIRNNNRNSSKELEENRVETAALQKKCEEAAATIDKLNAELAEARATLGTAEEVMKQMEQFESVLKKRDEKIKALKDENADLIAKKESLEADNKRLAADLESNIMDRAVAENEMKSTIEELSKKTLAPEKPRRKRKTTPKISAIDETLDSTEWLVATPPDNAPKLSQGSTDSEFGYQEPPKKSHPANDAQMSLF